MPEFANSRCSRQTMKRRSQVGSVLSHRSLDQAGGRTEISRRSTRSVDPRLKKQSVYPSPRRARGGPGGMPERRRERSHLITPTREPRAGTLRGVFEGSPLRFGPHASTNPHLWSAPLSRRFRTCRLPADARAPLRQAQAGPRARPRPRPKAGQQRNSPALLHNRH